MAVWKLSITYHLLGDNLKQTIKPGAKLKIAASSFSIYAFEALKKGLESVESLEFIFTSPTFLPNEVTDHVRKERREFHIPKAERERRFYGSEFEIFSEFLEDLNEDVLPNDKTGYQDSLVWQKLFNFQRDAATGIINKLETFNLG